MNRYVRGVLLIVIVVQALLALGFFIRLPVFVELWPLPVASPTSYTFIASIYLAAAASTLWCVLAKERAGLAGVGLDYMTISAPAGFLVLQLSATEPTYLPFGLAFALAVAAGAAMFIWALRSPFRATQRTPRPLLIAFGVFVVLLLLVGSQLVLGTDMLPWATNVETAVIYGWFFIGAAAYFAYGLVRPVWGNAGGQLAGFLAYDLVLIVPFLTLLPTISDERRLSLIVYLIVLVSSGLLALYYLVFSPETGLLRRRQAAQTQPPDITMGGATAG